MNKPILKKSAKFAIIFFLSMAIVFVVLIILFVGVLFLMQTFVPENPQKINENICLHFEHNMGSNEHVLIFSYYCNTDPDWDIVMNPSIELLHKNIDCFDGRGWDIEGCALLEIWNEQGILDQVDTMECPLIKIENNAIIIKQNKFCKWLAHDYPEPDYLKYSVDEGGEFILKK